MLRIVDKLSTVHWELILITNSVVFRFITNTHKAYCHWFRYSLLKTFAEKCKSVMFDLKTLADISCLVVVAFWRKNQ